VFLLDAGRHGETIKFCYEALSECQLGSNQGLRRPVKIMKRLISCLRVEESHFEPSGNGNDTSVSNQQEDNVGTADRRDGIDERTYISRLDGTNSRGDQISRGVENDDQMINEPGPPIIRQVSDAFETPFDFTGGQLLHEELNELFGLFD
jgi:hypothetical protein